MAQRIPRILVILFGYLVFSVFILFPLLWIFLMSIKDFKDIIAYPPVFTFTPTFDNYRAIIFGEGSTGLTTGISDYMKFLRNSVIISVGSVTISALIGTPAAYALSRSNIRGRDTISFTFLSFRFAPELAVILPLYAIYKKIGLYNTYHGLILANQLITLPLTIWILMSFFKEVPMEIEEAARVDGASVWQTFFNVALPIIRPGIASALIISFIYSWNNLIFGMVLGGAATQPVTVGILQTMNFDQIKWGWMAAAAMISAVPGMIIALYFQRHLVRGLTMGALK